MELHMNVIVLQTDCNFLDQCINPDMFVLLSWRWPCAARGSQQESHSDYQPSTRQTHRWVLDLEQTQTGWSQLGFFSTRNHRKALKRRSPHLASHTEFMFSGRDFSHDDTLDVPTQVELLIKQATSHENLCQCYIGWSVFSDQTDIMMTANTGSFPHLSCFSHRTFN